MVKGGARDAGRQVDHCETVVQATGENDPAVPESNVVGRHAKAAGVDYHVFDDLTGVLKVKGPL